MARVFAESRDQVAEPPSTRVTRTSGKAGRNIGAGAAAHGSTFDQIVDVAKAVAEPGIHAAKLIADIPGSPLAGATGGRPKKVPTEARAVLKENLPAIYDLATGGHPSISGLAVEGASVFPFGRAARGVRAGVKAAQVAKEAEIAAKAAERVAPLGKTPAEFKTAMTGAKIQATKQEALRSAERGKRGAAYREEFQANPTAEGQRAASQHLKGPLPSLPYSHFRNLTPEAMDVLHKVVVNHPGLQDFEVKRTIAALERVRRGETPAENQRVLLERVFGPDVEAGVAKELDAWSWEHTKHVVGATANIPRAFQASMDFSGMLRQGLVVAASHPVMFSKAVPPAFKAMFKEGTFQEGMAGIQASPHHDMLAEMGVPFTDLGHTLTKREEGFVTDYAEKLNLPIPGLHKTLPSGEVVRRSVGPGHLVRGSSRGYVLLLNQLRQSYGEHLIDIAHSVGIDPGTDQVLQNSIARFVGDATGRGQLPRFLADHYVTLNALMFSPRLLASRLDFLYIALLPAKVTGLHPIVRREAILSAAKLTAAITSIVGMAALAGAKVVKDPRNPDWAKIRVGNTRVDVLGGFQQPLRLIAQELTRTKIDSSTGEKTHLNLKGQTNQAWKFIESKAAPITAAILDVHRGRTGSGDPATWQRELWQHGAPLGIQDAFGASSVPAGVGTFIGSGLGLGIQNYGTPGGGFTFPSLPSGPAGGAGQGTGGRRFKESR